MTPRTSNRRGRPGAGASSLRGYQAGRNRPGRVGLLTARHRQLDVIQRLDGHRISVDGAGRHRLGALPDPVRRSGSARIPATLPGRSALGELDTIAVDPSCWRQGVGRVLMVRGLVQLGARWDRAILWTPANYPRGNGFFKAMGWQQLDNQTLRHRDCVRPTPPTDRAIAPDVDAFWRAAGGTPDRHELLRNLSNNLLRSFVRVGVVSGGSGPLSHLRVPVCCSSVGR